MKYDIDQADCTWLQLQLLKGITHEGSRHEDVRDMGKNIKKLEYESYISIKKNTQQSTQIVLNYSHILIPNESFIEKSVDLGDKNMEAKFKDLSTESVHIDIEADESKDERVDVKLSKIKEGTAAASDVDCVPETDSDEGNSPDGNNSRKRKDDSVMSEVLKEDDDGGDDGNCNDSHKHHHKKHKNTKKAKYREKTERRKDRERRHKERKRDREINSKSSQDRHKEYCDRKHEKNLQNGHGESSDAEEHRSRKKSDDHSNKESKVTEENGGNVSETYTAKIEDSKSVDDRSRMCESKSDKRDTDSISQAENMIGKQKREKVKMENRSLFEKETILLQSVPVQREIIEKKKNVEIKHKKETNVELQLEGNSSLYQTKEKISKGETSDKIKKLKSEDIKAALQRHCESVTSDSEEITNINTSGTSCHEEKKHFKGKVQSSSETLMAETEMREVEDRYRNSEFNDSRDSEENSKPLLKTGKQFHPIFGSSRKSLKSNQSKPNFKGMTEISPKRKYSPIMWDSPGASSQKKIKGFISGKQFHPIFGNSGKSLKSNQSKPNFKGMTEISPKRKYSPIMWDPPGASSQKNIKGFISKVPDLSETIVANIKKHELMKIGIPDLITWLKHPDNIYIGRNMEFYVKGATASKWGNPFSVKKYGRDKCIQMFEEHIKKSPHLYNSLEELTGKCLGCWCHPEPCHGHVLVRLLNEKLAKKANIKINQ